MKVQREFKNMDISGSSVSFLWSRFGKGILVSLLSVGLLFATLPENLAAYQAPPQSQDQVPPPDGQAPPQGQAPPYATQTPEQLQRLVAPVALYPDSLV